MVTYPDIHPVQQGLTSVNKREPVFSFGDSRTVMPYGDSRTHANFPPLPILQHRLCCLFHPAASWPFPTSTIVLGFYLHRCVRHLPVECFLVLFPWVSGILWLPVKSFLFQRLLKWARRRFKYLSRLVSEFTGKSVTRGSSGSRWPITRCERVRKASDEST